MSPPPLYLEPNVLEPNGGGGGGERVSGSGGGDEKGGGSPGTGPTPGESKDVGRDGATLCIINQKQSRKNAAARPSSTALIVFMQVWK